MDFSFFKRFAYFTLLVSTSFLWAGSFSLYNEGSVSAVQNFAAGIAAEGRDASVGWYNPAALVLLKKREFVGGGVGVNPVAHLSGSSKLYQFDPNTEENPELYGPYTESFKNLSGAREAIVPNFHLAIPLGNRLVYAVSMVAPLGLSSNWPATSAVRYAGTYSNLRVIDLSPELGMSLNENFSIGAGVDLQWASVNFDNVIGAAAVLPVLQPDTPATEWDTSVKNDGKSFGTGFHVGFLSKWNADRTRLGFNYLYGVTQHFQGTSQVHGMFADGNFENINADAISNQLRADPVKFPDILTFSAFHQMTDRLAVMGSLVYSVWSSFKSITLYNIPVASIPDNDLILQNATAVQNYHNTFRLAFGVNYQLTNHLELRGGTGWDQTPTNSTDRDVRLPDVDKYALAVGARWQPIDAWAFDIAYSYLWPLQNSTIHKTQYLDSRNWVEINATGHTYAQLLALGIRWRL